MRLGVSIFPTDTTIQPIELAREAEARGFDSLWFPEHSHIPASRRTPWGGRPGADPLPPYVRLIHDVLIGDRSLFTRPDGLAAAWKTVTPLLTDPPQVASYAPGSWGPAAARKLIAPGRWLLGQ